MGVNCKRRGGPIRGLVAFTCRQLEANFHVEYFMVNSRIFKGLLIALVANPVSGDDHRELSESHVAGKSANSRATTMANSSFHRMGCGYPSITMQTFALS